jgi:hypothetical protein
MMSRSDRAWNNFVLNSDKSAYDRQSVRWAAAVANQFMASVMNGGMNSFLTYSYDMDACEFVRALSDIGAHSAADQLETVLRQLGIVLMQSTEGERWNLLDRYWTEDLDRFENLSEKAEAELMSALSAHVADEEDFYTDLTSSRAQSLRLADRQEHSSATPLDPGP